MKRSRLKNKESNSRFTADKTAYKNKRNLVVKLNKDAKKFFLKKPSKNWHIFDTLARFENYVKLFSLKKVFITDRNLLLLVQLKVKITNCKYYK